MDFAVGKHGAFGLAQRFGLSLLSQVCRAIIALLDDPDPSSPLNCDAGSVTRPSLFSWTFAFTQLSACAPAGNMVRAGDMRAYHSMARMFVQKFAS